MVIMMLTVLSHGQVESESGTGSQEPDEPPRLADLPPVTRTCPGSQSSTTTTTGSTTLWAQAGFKLTMAAHGHGSTVPSSGYNCTALSALVHVYAGNEGRCNNAPPPANFRTWWLKLQSESTAPSLAD
eukprot:2677840-Rhodomonas_salina.2